MCFYQMWRKKTSYAVQGTQKLFLTTTANAYLFE